MKKAFKKTPIKFILTIMAVVLLLVAPELRATTHEFYKGKTLRIVVGFAAGGGFDTYSRAIARHMGKHIPGNPTLIVENMTGAGSLIAANHVYRVAKPDGLTMGNFSGTLFMGQVLGRSGIEFDAVKFEHIGVPVKDNPVCAFSKASGITSFDKWFTSKTPVKLGSTAPGALVDDFPRILRAALGLPVHLVAGYKGTADIRLAIEAGEVAGGCWAWDSIKATWSKGIESGDALIVVQLMPKPHPELPNIPLAINFAKTEEARQLIQVGIHDQSATNRPYVLTPGTPKERVQALRKAFMDTMKDPDFLADAEKSKLDLDPMPGEELERTIANLFKLSPSLVANLKEALGVK